MTWRLDRRVLAAAVLVCWIVGLVALARRRHSITDTELLARGALRLEPATYFYIVSQDSQPIGSASSAIDTTPSGFTSHDIVRIRTPVSVDSQLVTTTSTAYLSRGFALDSFALSVGGQRPFRLRGVQQIRPGLLLPSVVPIAMMLMHEPRIGASTQSWIFNPPTRRIELVTLRVAAESLFSVADSAVFDSASHAWTAAHIDTVRSWEIVTPSRALTAWVDSRGRIVAAKEAGGASLMRTAYEIATLNSKQQSIDPARRSH